MIELPDYVRDDINKRKYVKLVSAKFLMKVLGNNESAITGLSQ